MFKIPWNILEKIKIKFETFIKIKKLFNPSNLLWIVVDPKIKNNVCFFAASMALNHTCFCTLLYCLLCTISIHKECKKSIQDLKRVSFIKDVSYRHLRKSTWSKLIINSNLFLKGMINVVMYWCNMYMVQYQPLVL